MNGAVDGNGDDDRVGGLPTEEAIGVDVERILRGEMPSVSPPVRALTEQESRLFADTVLETELEGMIPSPRQERQLMRDGAGWSGKRRGKTATPGKGGKPRRGSGKSKGKSKTKGKGKVKSRAKKGRRGSGKGGKKGR